MAETTCTAYKELRFWGDNELLSRIQDRKLFVVTPYRNRTHWLEGLYLYYRNKSIISNRWIVVEQDNIKPFNIARLLNIGYRILREYEDSFYYLFHCLDGRLEKLFYSPSAIVGYTFKCSFYPKCFIWPNELFERLNGINILYDGWGTEDDDMFIRCGRDGIPLIRVHNGEYDLSDNKNRERDKSHYGILEKTRQNKPIPGLVDTGFKINSIQHNEIFITYKVDW